MKIKSAKSLVEFAVTALVCLSLCGCLALSGSNNAKGAGGANGAGPATGGTSAFPPVPPTPGPNNGPTGDLSPINHIIFMSQENRSFDTYFGHLNDYRSSQGLPTDVDGMPANAKNPALDGTIVPAFHLQTMCVENTSADWATSHINCNRLHETPETP